MKQNESLNNTCILFVKDNETQQKAIIKFFNDNGWESSQEHLRIWGSEDCIGICSGTLGRFWSKDMRIIDLPKEYYPIDTPIVESEIETLRKEHKLMVESFNLILQKRNSVGWDAECSALVAEETLKKITRK